MLRRNKKNADITQSRRSRHTAKGIAARAFLKIRNIARFFSVPTAQAGTAPAKKPEKGVSDKPALPARYIVFSDTDNDVESVKSTLLFAGIVNEAGDFVDGVEGITILHTGDFLDKKNPDLAVVEYWRLLRRKARRAACRVKLIVGNHEQEVWRRTRTGNQYGVDALQAKRLDDFIANLDLFHVYGPILFIHGYPTLEFLQTLLHYKDVTGKDLNSFNRDHYKISFKSIRAVKQYAYVKESRKTNHLLYDLADARRYYKKHGQPIGAILAQLNIEIVVHGHKPQRSGKQADYEFCRWIPGVRMIGNDTNVSSEGIGATVIRETSDGALDVVFVNMETASDELRRTVQQDLREPFESTAAVLPPDTL